MSIRNHCLKKSILKKCFGEIFSKSGNFRHSRIFPHPPKLALDSFLGGGGKSHQYTMSEIHFESMTQRLQKASYFKLWKGKIDTRHCYDHSITLILMKLGNINSWICEIKNTRGIFDILFFNWNIRLFSQFLSSGYFFYEAIYLSSEIKYQKSFWCFWSHISKGQSIKVSLKLVQ